MKNYWIYLKVPFDMPDYEDRVKAVNKKEAVNYFMQNLKGFSKKEIARNTICEDNL